IGLSYIGIGIGLVLAVQDTRQPTSRLGLFLFILFSLAGFPLGLRGEVLMPLVAATVVYMHARATRPRWLLLIGSFIVFASISLAREIRREGIGSGFSTVDFEMNPLAAIEEL